MKNFLVIKRMSGLRNIIVLYIDQYNNILSFADGTGTYPLTNSQEKAVRSRVVPLNPQLAQWLNDYKSLYSQRLQPSCQKAAGAAFSAGKPINMCFSEYLDEFAQALVNELRRYV
jgi:hypothetical protein